jgi:hypothetical protein
MFNANFGSTRSDSCRGFCNSALEIDYSTHSMTGVAIFFLLAFRANNSYARFSEVSASVFASWQ